MRAQKSSNEEGDDSLTLAELNPNSILLIYSIVETLERGEVGNLITDLETIDTAHAIAEALRHSNYQVTMAAIRSENDLITALSKIDRETTLVFNLCEALGGFSNGESQVPRLLDKLGFYYVGAAAQNLDDCLDKNCTKGRLLAHGIPTAPYQIFYTGNELITVPFPSIVKPMAEDCSMGITRDSVVNDEASLRCQVAYILKVYKQPALVEMFLDGREFNVSMWGNGITHVLSIAEVDYADCEDVTLRVDNFEAKWSNRFAAIHPAPIDSNLKEYISQIGLAAYKTMGCRDYARVDLREKNGQLYVLEVNPNPCLSAGAGFANAAQIAGYDYAHMACQLVEWAWWRNQHDNKRS